MLRSFESKRAAAVIRTNIPGLVAAESRRQTGVALISIMLILAVLATLIIYATEQQNLSIRRAENLGVAEQGYQVNLSGEQWAVKVLENDMQDDLLRVAGGGVAIDHVGEGWANLGPPVEVGNTGTTLFMTATDQQAFLNINNLRQGKTPAQSGETQLSEGETGAEASTSAMWFQIFQKLLISLELNPELIDAVIDWVDDDQNPIGTTGAEDLYYSGLELPYRTADRTINSVAELTRIKDFDSDVLEVLLPWISALPVGEGNFTPVNVNTAPARILALFALGPLASSALEPLIAQRALQPFETLADFQAEFAVLSPDGLVPGFDQMLAVNSRFYAGRSCAAAGRVKFSMSSLLEKMSPGNNVKVLQRERFFGCPDLSIPDSESDADSSNPRLG